MRQTFDITTIAHLSNAVSHYLNFAPSLIDNLTDKGDWNDIAVHIVSQWWGSTSGGWQTIGGSAMTRKFTVVVENASNGIACVYYSGVLAYACHMDDKYNSFLTKNLPGMSTCEKDLNVIYKKTL